jgi:hypothetical protein
LLGGNIIGQVVEGGPKAGDPIRADGTAISPELLKELMPAGLPAHVEDGIVRSFAACEPFAPTKGRDPASFDYAWVQRDGTFWGCRGYMDHIATADQIAAQLGLSLGRWNGNAEHALGELGWAKVGYDAAHDPGAWIDCTKRPGEAQFDAVTRWLVSHKADPLTIQRWADTRNQ